MGASVSEAEIWKPVKDQAAEKLQPPHRRVAFDVLMLIVKSGWSHKCPTDQVQPRTHRPARIIYKNTKTTHTV